MRREHSCCGAYILYMRRYFRGADILEARIF
jgi:hypothetical protein